VNRLIRKRLLSLLIVLLFTFSLLGVLNLSTIKVSAAEYPAIYIDPPAIVDPTLTPGSNFNVSIKTNYTGNDITAWQFTLYFNPDVLYGGLNQTDTWTGNGTTTFTLTQRPILEGSVKVYVNQTLIANVTQRTDTWTGDGTTRKFNTTVKPVFRYSEKIYLDDTLAHNVTEETDKWTGDGTTTKFYTTGKPVVIYSEEVYVNDTLVFRDIDFTIDYATGAITFETAPGVDADIKVKYQYGHYTINYAEGAITFETAPGAGAEINATYLHPQYFIDYLRRKLTFITAPGAGAQIKAIYQYGGITNGDLITRDKNINAKFYRGTFNNTVGNLSLTSAYFYFAAEPAPITSGPGTLAYITFTVVGRGRSNITLGPDTQLIGYTEGGWGKAYRIIDAETMPDHIGHGYFSNAGAISGTVTDAYTELPISGTTVTAVGPETYSSTTGTDGTYLLADVQPGQYTVTASKPGYYTESKPVTVVAEAVTVNFELQRIVGWINGYVTDNVTTLPIANALVTADTIASDTTDNTGYYKIEIEPGTYNLTASKAGYYDGVVYDVSVSAKETVPINFTLNPISVYGWINGTVRDANTGSPIVGAKVTAKGVASSFTDGTGHYSILVPAPGTYNVTASKPGYYTSLKTGIFVDIGTTEIVNFELQLIVGWIDGTVTDAKTGSAIVDVTVTADGVSNLTDETGYYNIELVPGDYTVNASKPGYYNNSTFATVTGGKTTTVNFELQLIVGWINGTVTDASTGKEIKGANVTANGYSNTTDTDGNYNIIVPVGNYTVTASKSGYYSSVKYDISVSENLNTTVNFELQLIVAWINGTITDASTGEPLTSVTVTAGRYSNTTNMNGYYTIRITPGTYIVNASRRIYGSILTHYPNWVSVTVSAGETKTVNLALTPIPGAIDGTVTHALTGEPIADAIITLNGYSTTTNANGYYRITDISPGNYAVNASKTDYYPNSTSVTIVRVITKTVNLALTPIPGAIDGTVTDALTEEPIAGATVEAVGLETKSTTTDAYGHYNITIAPGTYTVTASATGYETTSQTDIPVFTEETTTVNFALRVISTITISADPTTITVGENTTISGSIDPTREGVTVTIWYRLSGEETWNNLTTVTTNEYSQYSYVWTPETAEIYEVKASWLGDEDTTPAESNVQTITVQEKPSGIPWYLYIVAAGGAAIIIAAAAFYFLKIRKPKPT